MLIHSYLCSMKCTHHLYDTLVCGCTNQFMCQLQSHIFNCPSTQIYLAYIFPSLAISQSVSRGVMVPRCDGHSQVWSSLTRGLRDVQFYQRYRTSRVRLRSYNEWFPCSCFYPLCFDLHYLLFYVWFLECIVTPIPSLSCLLYIQLVPHVYIPLPIDVCHAGGPQGIRPLFTHMVPIGKTRSSITHFMKALFGSTPPSPLAYGH